MLFKKIYMHGFKSFADPVTIELDNGITCVVGPNGAGKSNISDALRWVLGEQSPKQLRGGKMEEVIFAGTKTRKPKGMAEVTLLIDNSDKSLPIEYNEVSVTRRMFRSGENEYIINGNQCRLRDIRELFMDTGIGVEGYSIIGQGKIADLISTKPENRREIFEESAGVVMYKTRKASAEKKIKTANDNLDRVRDIIAEIEGRIDDLREDSSKAKEYIELRDRYKYLSVNIIIHNIQGIDKNLIIYSDDLKSMKESLNSFTDSLNKLENELEELRIREDELNDIIEESNTLLIEKINELNRISNRGQLNSARLVQLDKDISRLNNNIEYNKNKLLVENEKFIELETLEKDIDIELSKDKENIEKTLSIINDRKTKLKLIENEIESNKNELIDLNSESIRKKAEIGVLSNYLTTLLNRKDEIVNEHKTKDESFTRNKLELEKINLEIESKVKNIKEIESLIDKYNNEINTLESNSKELNDRIQDNSKKRTIKESRKATLIELENRYDGYNNSVRSLMNRRINGLIGTVSDLISVPNGYENAIETVLGNQMQNIVCENDKSAKEAVIWLKSSGNGRATFLPLKSIKGKKISPDVDTVNSAGYLGIASDIVKSESKYHNILNYLLGRIIVVDTMDNAIKISKKNTGSNRIVTLDGEVVNASGAITGGKYRHKTSNILARKKEIDALEHEINNLIIEEKLLINKKSNNDKDISIANDKKKGIYDELKKFEIEHNILMSDYNHINERVNSAKEKEDRYERDVNNIKKDIESTKTLIEKYKQEISESEEFSIKLNKNTSNLIDQGENYKDLLNEDNEELIVNRLSLKKNETKKLSNNELIEQIRDNITDYKDLIESTQSELESFINEKNVLSGNSESSDEIINELKTEKEELEKKIESSSRELEDNKNQYKNNIKSQKEINNEISHLQDDIHKNELKITKNETVIESLKDKLWDEFETSYAEAFDIKEEDLKITSANKEVKEIKIKIAELGEVNIGSISEYEKVKKRYEFMISQESDIKDAITELTGIINSMERTIKIKFNENFKKVAINFEEMFKVLFGGGYAELRLEDDSNPLESGIEIIAQPPGKKLRNINLMSGGEKTLIGVALMFAVLKAKPTPFCILDEVEAALDESNIEKFGNCLKSFDDIQFAIITHQKKTMEHADVLYGVTMPEHGISKLISLKLSEREN